MTSGGQAGGSGGDLGYFGPASVTWRLHGDPVVAMTGGLRALLLQALHPDAMRLLAERSSFRDDPWPRLQRTVAYVATVSFAPRERVDAAAARVRAIHHALGVDDPHQLAWVHACLVDSFLHAGRAAGIGLDDDDADRYVREQVHAARLAGVPRSLTPGGAGELRAHLDAARPGLRATREACDAARCVLAPPLPVPRRYAVPARLGWNALAAVAVGLLPAWARAMYRLPPLPGAGLAASAGIRGLRLAARTLPAGFREGPALADARRRARAAADAG